MGKKCWFWGALAASALAVFTRFSSFLGGFFGFRSFFVVVKWFKKGETVEDAARGGGDPGPSPPCPRTCNDPPRF